MTIGHLESRANIRRIGSKYGINPDDFEDVFNGRATLKERISIANEILLSNSLQKLPIRATKKRTKKSEAEKLTGSKEKGKELLKLIYQNTNDEDRQDLINFFNRRFVVMQTKLS